MPRNKTNEEKTKAEEPVVTVTPDEEVKETPTDEEAKPPVNGKKQKLYPGTSVYKEIQFTESLPANEDEVVTYNLEGQKKEVKTLVLQDARAERLNKRTAASGLRYVKQ